jgi:hypothetical protein
MGIDLASRWSGRGDPAGQTTLPLLFVLAALHGTARVFIGPALSAVAPNIVPAPLIPRAMALEFDGLADRRDRRPGCSRACSSVPSPPCPTGRPVPCSWCMLPCCRSAACRRPKRTADEHPLRQMIEGFRYVWNERFLLGCVTLDLFAVLLGGATALLPVFARDILHVGAEGLGQ